MRILTFLHSFEPGGVERDALRLVDALAKEELDMHVALGRTTGALANEPLPDVPFHVFEKHGARTAGFETLWMIARLPALVRRLQPDVIWCAGNTYSIVAVALRLALGRRCPPIVLKVSNDLRRLDLPAPARWAYTRWLRLQTPVFAAIVAMAAPVVDEIKEQMRARRERIHVINNASIRAHEAEALAATRDAARRHHKGRRFLAVGRLVPQKNFALLIDAFARIATPDDRLTIIGEGGERATLERRIAHHGLFRQIALPGHRNPLYDAFAEADVFVLSSNYEGLGVVVIEALAAGLPVVATNCCSAMPMLVEGAGRLVPTGDAATLASAMDAIVHDRLSPEMMRARAKTFTVETATAAWRALFQSVAAARPRA